MNGLPSKPNKDGGKAKSAFDVVREDGGKQEFTILIGHCEFLLGHQY